MKKFLPILFALLIFPGKIIYAQDRVEAEAFFMRDHIRIGEQVELKIAVRYREGTQKSVVTWPGFKDTLTKGVEVLKIDTIHTQLASRASVLYEQSRSITVTAFDSGMYAIPPQKFVVDKDTVYTALIYLYVSTVAVDTTKPIKDIKQIFDVPPPPVIEASKDPIHWWVWIILIFCLFSAIVLVLYFLNRKKNIPFLSSFMKQLLPHEKVLKELAELGIKKPWLRGQLKEYHIALTEILRAWIVERYHIHAKEMTTGEIVYALNKKDVAADAVSKIQQVLRMADMVKFAKGNPVPEENERSLQLAIAFVEATAIYPEVQVPPTQAKA